MDANLIAYLNGRFLPRAELTLSFADAGFVSGATVTDFCRTYRQHLFRWPDHCQRFRHDCAALGIHLEISDTDWTTAAERLVEAHAPTIRDTDDLALLCFATPGPLAYLSGANENGPPTFGMHTIDLPIPRYRRFFLDGVMLVDVGPPPEARFLPTTVKHRSRLHWWLAEREVQQMHPGAIPVFMNPTLGSADTAIGAVLSVIGDRVIASPVGSVLESISLRVIEEICPRLGLRFERGPFVPGEEALLAGSGFGVAGVKRIVGRDGVRDYAWPGRVYREMLAAWSDLVGMNIERQILGEELASSN
jgi:branched-chain amino acid aminotransferase